MRTWSFSIVGGALSFALLFGACSSGGGNGGAGAAPGVGGAGNETSCQKLCRRSGEVSAACKPADCEAKCEQALPTCDTEYRAVVDCTANAQMLGCDSSNKPSAAGECDSETSAFSSCLLGGTGGTGGGDSGTGGTGGSTGPCDPLKASCVACGTASCDSPENCCWESGGPACGASCTGTVKSACDGNEDCNGGQCCVQYLIGSDGSASSGTATCSAGGGSVCCNAQGGPGCAGDKTVETCVCAQDKYCCETDWDPQCAGEVAQFGCAACGEGCDLGNASTGSGSSIKSVACRTGADCAGVTGEFNVPYSECCKSTNFGVGACVSQTYAGSITDSGGTCD